MIVYNKLIRDRIPEIMEAAGKTFEIRTLKDDEYGEKLDEKLSEELHEYLQAKGKDKVEELADLVEVVYAILDQKGVSIQEFESCRKAKREKRGGFKEKLYLLNVNE